MGKKKQPTSPLCTGWGTVDGGMSDGNAKSKERLGDDQELSSVDMLTRWSIARLGSRRPLDPCPFLYLGTGSGHR